MYSSFFNGFYTTLGAIAAIAVVLPIYHAVNIPCYILRQKKKCSYRKDCDCGCESVTPPSFD